MRYFLIVIFGALLVLSCKEQEDKVAEKPELIMAETSEMAQLMREMYAFNESIRQQIIDGELANAYPLSFDKIHSAVLTDPSDRDASFEQFSNHFIKAERAVFVNDSDNLIYKYNNAINACISCHNVTCTGPIPRIKKLLIN